jgi:hypothetical protein
VAQFERGDFSTTDAHCPGWTKTMTTRISVKSTAEQLGISRERAWSIIY